MRKYIYEKDSQKDNLLRQMCNNVDTKGTRAIGFIWQSKDGKSSLYPFSEAMPSHLVSGWCNKHHSVILRFNYQVTRMVDGWSCKLDNVKLFYPAGIFIPYRVSNWSGEYRLHQFDTRSKSFIEGETYPMFDSNGMPHFPEQLMVDTWTGYRQIAKPKKLIDSDKEFVWKGLASQYIMA